MQAGESALVVPVPAAEAAVGSFRRRLDHAAALGVPAHITILYPFVDPAEIGPDLHAELSLLFAATPAFEFTLTEVGWFGVEVVWAHPEPVEPFRRLTHAVHMQYPAYPPYGGVHHEVVPHLTIGQHAATGELQRAAAHVEAQLPIAATASHVDLMAGSERPGSWRVLGSFPLATEK